MFTSRENHAGSKTKSSGVLFRSSFKYKERIHLVGIGGIGMSGLAQLLLASGLRVRGSDLKYSPLIQKLERQGMNIIIGHSSANIKDADLVIFNGHPLDYRSTPELVFIEGKVEYERGH